MFVRQIVTDNALVTIGAAVHTGLRMRIQSIHCRIGAIACAIFVAGCSSSASSNGADGGGGGMDLGSSCGDGFHDPTTASCWPAAHAPRSVSGSFQGATFDGRYVYFAPANGSSATRYDAQAAFDADSSWTTTDFAAGNAQALDYAGAVFDGRYVYFIPALHAVVARLDTQLDFASTAAWSQFDTTGLAANAGNFAGATFDGRYLYVIPSDGPVLVRLDTQSDFGAVSSWTALTIPTNNSSGFFGGVFDGRYVYLIPGKSVAGEDLAVDRYDTEGAVDVAASWSSFDITQVDSAAGGFRGGAFDGRYLYLVPWATSGVFGVAYGGVWRYDTMAAFGAQDSWSRFDTAQLSGAPKGFFGAAFDGRYVYYVPATPTAERIMARFDSQGDFASASSWSTFDMAKGNGDLADSYVGAVFDGQFIYFMPTTGGAVAHFDARSPPALPALPAHHGSFF